MGKWKYWSLLILIMVAETARQNGIDTFWFASVQDLVLVVVLAFNWRRWSWMTWAAIATALSFVGLHNAIFGIPPEIGAFGARGLVYLTATVDILTAADRQLVATKQAMSVMAFVWSVAAVYAIYQQVSGFRYHDDFSYYNQAPLSAADTSLLRMPSFFYNFSTYAKFCLSGLLVMLALVARTAIIGGTSAGILAASVVVGVVLSGQRAAVAVAMVITALFLLRPGGAARKWLSMSVAGVAVVCVGVMFPLYLQRAESSASLERIDENLIEGMPNAFSEIPLSTGIGMGRMTSAATRYDFAFNTNWGIPEALQYRGAEGILHFAFGQGGLPWLTAMVIAMLWGFRPGAGRTSQRFLLAYTLWGITHDMWSSPQVYVLTLLPFLGAIDLGRAARPVEHVAARPQAGVARPFRPIQPV